MQSLSKEERKMVLPYGCTHLSVEFILMSLRSSGWSEMMAEKVCHSLLEQQKSQVPDREISEQLMRLLNLDVIVEPTFTTDYMSRIFKKGSPE